MSYPIADRNYSAGCVAQGLSLGQPVADKYANEVKRVTEVEDYLGRLNTAISRVGAELSGLESRLTGVTRPSAETIGKSSPQPPLVPLAQLLHSYVEQLEATVGQLVSLKDRLEL